MDEQQKDMVQAERDRQRRLLEEEQQKKYLKRLEESVRRKSEIRRQEREEALGLRPPSKATARPLTSPPADTKEHITEIELTDLDEEESKNPGESGSQNGLYPPGTILLLGDNTVGIYKSSVPQKGYDVVYCLGRDGKVHARGVCLHAYDFKKIGMLPTEHYYRLQRLMEWDRDAVVFHLDSFEDVKDIYHPDPNHTPQISESPTEPESDEKKPEPVVRKFGEEIAKAPTEAALPPPPAPAPPPAPTPLPNHTPAPQAAPHPRRAASLERGRKFQITIGDRAWEGIFWGSDEQGSIVVHCTNKEWALMHLNLGRFRDSLVIEDLIDDAQMREIESFISKQYVGRR